MLERARPAASLARQREEALRPGAAVRQPATAAQVVKQRAHAGAGGLPNQLGGDLLVGQRGVALAVLAGEQQAQDLVAGEQPPGHRAGRVLVARGGQLGVDAVKQLERKIT